VYRKAVPGHMAIRGHKQEKVNGQS